MWVMIAGPRERKKGCEAVYRTPQKGEDRTVTVWYLHDLRMGVGEEAARKSSCKGNDGGRKGKQEGESEEI